MNYNCSVTTEDLLVGQFFSYECCVRFLLASANVVSIEAQIIRKSTDIVAFSEVDTNLPKSTKLY